MYDRPSVRTARATEAAPRDDAFDGPVELSQTAPPWQAWIEIAAMAALVIAARMTADLGLAWLALAPALAGLRYGWCAGVACAAVQVAALTTAAHAAVTDEAPGGQAILGWLLAGLVPGQFCDAWSRHRHRLEVRVRDASRRLAGLARAYHVVVASHDQLRREIPGSPSSLRDALEALAHELVESQHARRIESFGVRVLELFRAHASVRAATLHLVDAHARIAPPVATLGAPTRCEDCPLIREAAELGEVVSVRDLATAATTLVAVPLVDVSGQVHAVVAVHELPFLFLHQDTITLLAVLGGHLGDLMVRARDAAHAVVKTRVTRGFCASVSRSLDEARRYGIAAALAVLELEAPPGQLQPRVLACMLAADRRISDQAEIVLGSDGTLRVVVLLELADAAGLRSYLDRVEHLAFARAHELGSRCAIRLGGWSLDASPLPRRARDLEVALATLLHSADPSLDSSTSRRRHGLVA